MLRLTGSTTRLCDGLPRRDLLQVGSLAALGLGVPDWMRLQAAQSGGATSAGVPEAGRRFGQAKSCILVFLSGSPPQHETFDPKPDAPAEIQGEMQAIQSSVAGLSICERLPRHAQIMDRVTVVRSMTHPFPEHGVGYVTSTMPLTNAELNSLPRDPRQRPYIGSVVGYLDGRGATGDMPPNIGLPWLFGSKSDKYGRGTKRLSGPYASFLGQAHDPVWTDFEGRGTRVVPKLDAVTQTEDVLDPFAGITADGRFSVGADSRLPDDVTESRLTSRRSLLDQFSQARHLLDSHPDVGLYDRHQQLAWSLMTSSRMADALDVQRESADVREKYGMTLFGQSLLAARRLIEAGGKFVSVFWDPFGPFGGSCWDTHANHFPRLKQYLLPVCDQSFPALILDLDERGLLDETAVLCISEHGRTPRIDSGPKGAARHHWSRAYSALYAGGGFARGRVVGQTDAIGGDVVHTPVSPKDVLATTYHLLGISPDTVIPDQTGRPHSIVGDGIVRQELLG